MESQNSVILTSCEEEADPLSMDIVKEIVEKADDAEIEEGEYLLVSNVQEDLEDGEMQVIAEENETPSLSQMCRTCANANGHLVPIFTGEGLEQDLCSKIQKHLPIKVTKDDSLPQQLCYHCAATILAWSELSEGCLYAQNQLLRLQEQAEQRKSLAYQQQEEEKDDQIEENTIGDGKFVNRELPQEEQRKHGHMKNAQVKNEEVSESERSESKERLVFIRVKNITKNVEKVKVEEEDNQLSMNEENTIESNLPSQSVKRRKSRSSFKRSRSEQQLTKDQKLELDQCKFVIDDRTYYRCCDCSKVNSTVYNYFAHRNRHLGERPYTCHKCGKSFLTVSGLNRHERDVHVGLKKYKCDICERPFASKIARDEHRLTHTGEKPHVCEICGKAFTQKASLHVHKQFHSENLSHWCTMCDRGFKRKQELNKHILTHTGQKPYACDLCGKRFRSKGCISRHKRTHSQQKSHICELCGAAFAQKRYLKTHRHNKHKDA